MSLQSSTTSNVLNPPQSSDGYQIGASAASLVSFYGASPIAQRSSASQAAVITTASTTSTPYGYATQAQADSIVTLVNELRAALVALGAIKGS